MNYDVLYLQVASSSLRLREEHNPPPPVTGWEEIIETGAAHGEEDLNDDLYQPHVIAQKQAA